MKKLIGNSRGQFYTLLQVLVVIFVMMLVYIGLDQAMVSLGTTAVTMGVNQTVIDTIMLGWTNFPLVMLITLIIAMLVASQWKEGDSRRY